MLPDTNIYCSCLRVVLGTKIVYSRSGVVPDTNTVREALTRVLENIGLFSDLALRLPKIISSKLKDVKLKTVLSWAIATARSCKLLDEGTGKVSLIAHQNVLKVFISGE